MKMHISLIGFLYFFFCILTDVSVVLCFTRINAIANANDYFLTFFISAIRLLLVRLSEA